MTTIILEKEAGRPPNDELMGFGGVDGHGVDGITGGGGGGGGGGREETCLAALTEVIVCME